MTDNGIDITATEWTVSATEKVSTGDYESHDVHTTIKGEIPLSDPLTEDRRKELKAKLLAVHKEAQEMVERAAENRIAAEGHEDWSVRNGDSE